MPRTPQKTGMSALARYWDVSPQYVRKLSLTGTAIGDPLPLDDFKAADTWRRKFQQRISFGQQSGIQKRVGLALRSMR
jgi:hypothetical protein